VFANPLPKDEIFHLWENKAMSRNASKINEMGALLVGVLVLLNAAVGLAGPSPLTSAEADGYRLWLHSLEEAVTARASTDLDEANLLFPFDVSAWDLDNPRPYRHLSISKAVMELETKWNGRGAGNLNSSLMALANARNYVNLSEYDSALVWYDVAARLDSTGSFRCEISREGLACAASANDSLAMAQLMTNTLGAADLQGRQAELVLAYRWLLTERDGDSLTHLVQKMESHPAVMDNNLRFWHAFALSWLGRTDEALAQLRQLVLSGGLSNGLTEKQRGWVMKALPDAYFLLGDRQAARGLYAALSACGVQELKMWGKYQVAGLDFLDSRYLSAGNGFQQVCEGERFGAWQDQACSMVSIAKQLERIKAEGEPYGVANYYQP